MTGLGHVPRPPNFTVESTAFAGRFVSELPLAVLTTTPYRVLAIITISITKNTTDHKGR
ncbi:MAG: hypothetical protein WAU02_02215 [Candidatus Saccharimonadales bacterium]